MLAIETKKGSRALFFNGRRLPISCQGQGIVSLFNERHDKGIASFDATCTNLQSEPSFVIFTFGLCIVSRTYCNSPPSSFVKLGSENLVK